MSSDLYQVEEVIGRKSEGDKVYFRVKWGGYSSKYNTWEPEENLSNCGDLIKEFMEKEANKEQKRTLRSSPARSKKALAAAALSSDDEMTVVTKSTQQKKQVQKRAPRKTAKQPAQPVLSSPLPAGLFGREYALRPRDSRHLLLSSDEESSPAPSRKAEASSTANTSVSLTESNFKRQIADISKKGAAGSKKAATSTPQPKSSAHQSPQVKTKLKFDSSQLRRSGRNRGPVLTIEQVSDDGDRNKKSENNLSVIAEAEDDDPREAEGEREEEKVADDGGESYPAWPLVGWKEFALAAFVTGLAAIGYVCYTTDYCKYC